MRAWIVTSLALGGCAPPSAATAPATPSATPVVSAATANEAPASTTRPAASTATPDAGASPTSGGSVLVGDIVSTKSFDPKPVVDALAPDFARCYGRARMINSALRGRLKLRIQVNEAGEVVAVDAAPGGAADDPTLLACLAETIKSARFPKPGGTATIVAPLVFRPYGVSR